MQRKGKEREKREAPKSEHPSTYDESIPPLSYHAQDAVQASSSSPGTQRSAAKKPQKSRQSLNAGNSSDADAFETTYRPYSQYTGRWQVPPWARPQQNNAGALRNLILLIMGILLIPMLCVVLNSVLRAIIFLPFAVVGAIFFPFIMLAASLLGIAVLVLIFIAFLSPGRKSGRIKPPLWW
jgi:hypothetical protein